MYRTRNYRRHQRERIIKRKLNIVRNWWSEGEAIKFYGSPENRGKLSKGKVHCSCWMCRNKTYIESPIRDKRKTQETK